MMDVFILGTSGTVPCEDRPYSSALTRIEGECFLFDCGEGTQVGVQKTGVGFSNISNIIVYKFPYLCSKKKFYCYIHDKFY